MVALLVGLLICEGCTGVAAGNGRPDTNPAREFTKTLNHEGIKRTYHVHLPPGFSPQRPAPLVIAMHGGGGKGKRFDLGTTQGTLTAAADERGMILVFPEGIKKQWCDGRSEILKKKIYDDVGFISKIIDRMVRRGGVDPARVYATGISNGGFMSIRLAMDLSEKIAAVAPVTAQISRAIEDRKPGRPISVMIVNGTRDPLVPYNGGHVRLFRRGRSRGEILSTRDTVERFRRYNGCGGTPEKTILPDKAPDDGTRVVIEKYAGGRQGAEVTLVKVIDGGHTWPGGKQYLNPKLVGVVSRDINASEMILDFFLRHSR